MRNLAAVAALLLAIAPEAAAAAQFTVKLSDFSSSDVIGVTVKGGIVAGFRRVLARSTGSLTVSLPDGLCEARVRISFENGSNSKRIAVQFTRADNNPGVAYAGQAIDLLVPANAKIIVTIPLFFTASGPGGGAEVALTGKFVN